MQLYELVLFSISIAITFFALGLFTARKSHPKPEEVKECIKEYTIPHIGYEYVLNNDNPFESSSIIITDISGDWIQYKFNTIDGKQYSYSNKYSMGIDYFKRNYKIK